MPNNPKKKSKCSRDIGGRGWGGGKKARQEKNSPFGEKKKHENDQPPIEVPKKKQEAYSSLTKRTTKQHGIRSGVATESLPDCLNRDTGWPKGAAKERPKAGLVKNAPAFGKARERSV